MRLSRIGLVGVAALLGLATLACGGDDDDSSDSDTPTENGSDNGNDGGNDGGSGSDRDKLIASLSESASSDGEFTEEEAECMVPGMIDVIGVEQLMEVGAADNPDASLAELGLDVSDEQANAIYDAITECVDLRAKFVEGMTADGDTPDEQAECLSDAIDDDTFKTLIITSLVEGEEALDANTELTTAIQEAAVECMGAGG